MTRAEVLEIILANPGKDLFISCGGFIRLHQPVSKSKLLKAAKFIHSHRVSTYGEERPDLARYLDRPNGAKLLGWHRQIVTFDTEEVTA